MAMTTNEMETRPLPDGWMWTTIGAAAKVNYRDPSLREMADDTEVTFVPMAAVDDIEGKIAEPQTKTLGETRKGYTPFADGDVLFAKITPCMENGKAAIARNLKNGLGFGSTEFHVMKPGPNVQAEWLFYYVRQSSFRSEAKANFSGTAGQLRVKKNFIENHPLPLAPLAEQERIVAEIEKQFTRLDQALASLRRLQTNLSRYKASVLKAACEGRLVPQDPNDESADQLLQRILTKRRTQWLAAHPDKKYEEPTGVETFDLLELPSGWAWATLEQMSTLITSGSRGWSQYYSDEGVIFIRAQDINTDSLKLDSVVNVLLPDKTEGTRARVNQNDLLITITGANVTKAALVTQELTEAYVSQHVGLVKLVSQETASYLYFWIVSPAYGRRILEKSAYGAGKPGISLENLRKLVVGLPPLTEQQRIVVEVERRLSVITTLEQTITANLSRAERLRQSILHRAFTGQLVSQNPADEPASSLFARIRAQAQQIGSALPKTEPVMRTMKRTSLFDILLTSKRQMQVESLFHQSGFTYETIDEFYLELRNEVIIQKRLEVIHSDEGDVFVRVNPNAS